MSTRRSYVPAQNELGRPTVMKGRTVGTQRQWVMFQLRTDTGFEDIIVHSRQVFDSWIGAMAEARRRHRRFLALRKGRESLRPTNEADTQGRTSPESAE